MSKTAIIVLNWNNPSDTLHCLDSLGSVSNDASSIFVVDNGSTDDSVTRISAAYPHVNLIQTGTNLGYAGGNNVGIKSALDQGAEFVLILNNDVIVEPSFLAPMLAIFDAQPGVGIVTPLVAERTKDGNLVWALGAGVDHCSADVTRLHAGDPVASWRGNVPFEVGIASGAAMLVRREVFEQTRMFDEGYFLYYEEVDWCLAVRRAGFRVVAAPAAVVWHKISASLDRQSPVIDYYMTRNHLRLINRHWRGWRRRYLLSRSAGRQLLAIAAFTMKPQGGARTPHRNARLLALRDALTGQYGKMGDNVASVCCPGR